MRTPLERHSVQQIHWNMSTSMMLLVRFRQHHTAHTTIKLFMHRRAGMYSFIIYARFEYEN